MLSPFWRFVVDLFKVITVLSGWVLFSLQYANTGGTLGKELLVAIWVVAVAMVGYGDYIIVSLRRRARYGEALATINEGFSYVHDSHRNGRDPQTIIDNCRSLCNCIARAFEIITGKKCAVCIKLIQRPYQLPGEHWGGEVATLCRDEVSRAQREKRDDATIYVHRIEENTDFKTIRQNLNDSQKRFFFSNCIAFCDGYESSSFQVVGGRPEGGKIPLVREIVRLFKWKLGYKSTVVVPLFPLGDRRRDGVDMVGFLCVDSDHVGVFRKKFDVDLMVGIADGLFNLASEYIDLKNATNVHMPEGAT